ncbi:hypothetical protein [Stenotrophomonas maltophilia]|uniref:hypothetical protein n=1 Tax=Stenotrophomonas maltophilia TaxID=40324 RepID=UPI0015DF51DF|nr:hypothetical protein [Stenotrophomonas maltophilia]
MYVERPVRLALGALVACTSLLAGQALAEDAKFLGFQLGQRFSAPECESRATTSYSTEREYVSKFQAVATNCWQKTPDPSGPAPNLSGTAKVRLVSTQEPSGLRQIEGVLIDGSLEEVKVWTHGIEYQRSIADLLQSKYGKPASMRNKSAKNAVGGTFEIVEATWKTPDVVVTFLGAVDSIDWGLIVVQTPKGEASAARALTEDAQQRATF